MFAKDIVDNGVVEQSHAPPEQHADSVSDVETIVDLAPVTRAMQAWYAQISPWLQVQLKRALAQLSQHDKPLLVGTMFSGSDICHHVMRRLQQFWSAELNFAPPPFTFVFQCEIDASKRRFLAEQFPYVPFLFADAATLEQAKAKDEKSNTYVPVPAVDILVAGFSCKSRAKTNNSRSAHKGCVRGGTSETGLTFNYVCNYILRKKPMYVMLENVTTLTEMGEGGDDSDAAYIIKWFTENGYAATYFEVDAKEYGSYASRTRLYFVAFRKTHMDDWRLDCCRAMLSEMRLRETLFTVDDFLAPGVVVDQADLQPHSSSPGGKKEPLYEVEHAELFLSMGLAWPLREDTFLAEFPEHGKQMLCLTARSREIVYILHKKFAMAHDAKALPV